MMALHRSQSLLMFLAILTAALTSQGAEIRLRSQARPAGPIIRLSDLADVLGSPAERQMLERLELAVAPPSSGRRYMSASRVRDLLMQRGVNLIQHRLGGASTILVLGAKAVAAEEPATQTPATVQATPAPAAKAKTAQPIMAVAASKPLQKGRRIRREDVYLVPINNARRSGLLYSLDDVVGMETTRSIPADRTITDREVQRPILVRRNDLVTLFVRVGAVSVRKNMTAAEDGALGDLITVQDAATRRKLSAKVVGYQEVELPSEVIPASSAPRPSHTGAGRRRTNDSIRRVDYGGRVR